MRLPDELSFDFDDAIFCSPTNVQVLVRYYLTQLLIKVSNYLSYIQTLLTDKNLKSNINQII